MDCFSCGLFRLYVGASSELDVVGPIRLKRNSCQTVQPRVIGYLRVDFQCLFHVQFCCFLTESLFHDNAQIDGCLLHFCLEQKTKSVCVQMVGAYCRSEDAFHPFGISHCILSGQMSLIVILNHASALVTACP